jgi:ferredoxin--NADP+ reductase
LPGIYATGWVKRGPVGLIGHTKSDAAETVANLLVDAPDLARAPQRADAALDALLASKGLPVTDFPGWDRLDAHEIAAGAPQDRARVKVASRAEMSRIAARS